jgi:hypothetical protein
LKYSPFEEIEASKRWLPIETTHLSQDGNSSINTVNT